MRKIDEELIENFNLLQKKKKEKKVKVFICETHSYVREMLYVIVT